MNAFIHPSHRIYRSMRSAISSSPLITMTMAPSTLSNVMKMQCRHASSDDIPPLMIYQTASPNVFVSSVAIDLSAKVGREIHPKSLFLDTKPPKSFSSSKFRYISPKDFHHELPTAPVPEVAFLGRSNVGKSSLLNSLTQKHLARISKTPGRTQQVNYFGLYPKMSRYGQTAGKKAADKNVNTTHGQGVDEAIGYIIDLPGYGYAKAPDEVVEQWQIKTQEFLQQRIETGNLQRVYILLDARRGLSLFDTAILTWLDEAECDYTIILTKCDTVNRPQIIKFTNEICFRYHAQAHGGLEDASQSPFVHITSTKKKLGITDLMWSIDADFTKGANELRMLNTGSSAGWGKDYEEQ